MLQVHLAVLTALLLLSACGGESARGTSGTAIQVAPETRAGSFELPPLEGKATYRYTVDLPPAYNADLSGTVHRWQVKGTKGQVAPHVRVWITMNPPTLDHGIESAVKGPMGEREIVFKEETAHAYIVAARDPDGTWTQLDAWCKGEGLTPYCMIELYKVAKDSPQVEWALQVARSLRAVAAPKPATPSGS
jgi:hypothetical protein